MSFSVTSQFSRSPFLARPEMAAARSRLLALAESLDCCTAALPEPVTPQVN